MRKNEQSQSADTGRAWRCAQAGRELDASVYILQTMPGRCLWSDMKMQDCVSTKYGTSRKASFDINII